MLAPYIAEDVYIQIEKRTFNIKRCGITFSIIMSAHHFGLLHHLPVGRSQRSLSFAQNKLLEVHSQITHFGHKLLHSRMHACSIAKWFVRSFAFCASRSCLFIYWDAPSLLFVFSYFPTSKRNLYRNLWKWILPNC